MPISTINTNSIADDAVTVPKVTDQVLTHRNLIINGAMNVAQRGTSFTPSGVTYCLDRFAHYAPSPPSNAVQQSTDVPTGEGFEYSLFMDTVDLRHAVELPAAGKAGVFYSGQKLTLSFWAKTGTSTHSPTINMRFIDGAAYSSASSAFSSSNNAVTITDTWQRFAIQYTVDTTPTVSHFACGFSIGGTVNDLYLTGIQLEVGETATPFEHRSFGDELAKCQRYYQINYASWYGVAQASGYFVSSNITYKPDLRVTPAVAQKSFSSGSAGRFTSTAATNSTINGTTIYASPSSAGGNSGYLATWSADAEL